MSDDGIKVLATLQFVKSELGELCCTVHFLFPSRAVYKKLAAIVMMVAVSMMTKIS